MVSDINPISAIVVQVLLTILCWADIYCMVRRFDKVLWKTRLEGFDDDEIGYRNIRLIYEMADCSRWWQFPIWTSACAIGIIGFWHMQWWVLVSTVGVWYVVLMGNSITARRWFTD